MALLSIDPGRSYKGEPTIGYCLFSDMGVEVERGAISFENLIDNFVSHYGLAWVDKNDGAWDLDTVVIEDFVNDPKSARGGQRNGTSECIGAVEALCMKADVDMIRQRSDVLGPAKLHAGYEQKLKHLPHQDSAFLHGHEYLVRQGVLPVKGLDDTVASG